MNEDAGRFRKAKNKAKVAGVYLSAPVVLAHAVVGPSLLDPKVGEMAASGVKRLAELGNASTGTPIRKLNGAVKELATLSKIGLGTKANGGFGVSGGKAVLGAVEVGVPLTLLTVVMCGKVMMEKRRAEAEAAAQANEQDEQDS